MIRESLRRIGFWAVWAFWCALEGALWRLGWFGIPVTGGGLWWARLCQRGAMAARRGRCRLLTGAR